MSRAGGWACKAVPAAGVCGGRVTHYIGSVIVPPPSSLLGSCKTPSPSSLRRGYQRFLKYLEHTVVTGEAAGHRLHTRLSAAPGGGGGEQPPPATHGSSRFDADQSAADREGGGDDDEGAEAGGKAAGGGGGKAAHGIALKDWNAQKMAAKRERIAQRDSTAAYAADDETLHGLGLAALQVGAPHLLRGGLPCL